jgi:hypothetical protein
MDATANNWYVMNLLDGSYMTMESDERPDPSEALIWHDIAGNKWGVPANRHKVAYGPCTHEEASEFLMDISGYKQD